MGFKLRNVVEGCILGGLSALIMTAILPGNSFRDKLGYVMIPAILLLFLGAVGVNGYPLSTFTGVAWNWFKNRSVVLYNPAITLLKLSPIESSLDENPMQTRIAEWYEQFHDKNKTTSDEEKLIEGVNFRFAKDKNEDGLAAEVAPFPESTAEILDENVFVIEDFSEVNASQKACLTEEIDGEFEDIEFAEEISSTENKALQPPLKAESEGFEHPKSKGHKRVDKAAKKNRKKRKRGEA